MLTSLSKHNQFNNIQFSDLKTKPMFYDKIGQINLSEWSESIYNEFNISTPEEFVKYMVSNQDIVCYVLHNNDIFIGTISMVPNDLESLYPNYNNWIASVYIEKEFRNTGYLKILLDWIISKSNKEILYLWCKVELEKMYSKYGFELLHHNNYLNQNISIMRYLNHQIS
jgi:hypothetical protein